MPTPISAQRRRARRAARPLTSLPAALALVLTALMALAASATARPPGHAAVNRARLQTELDGLVKMDEAPPGAIIVVQRGSRRRVISAGVRQLGSPGRPQVGDRMRIASTAKAVSAAVALSLVSQGKLSLDDTVAETVAGLPRQWSAVTLAELLDHTSGLPDFSQTAAFRNYVVAHLHARPSPRFLLGFVAKQPLNFSPGSRYEYSNTDNFVVAMMAEAVTHRPYAQLLGRRINGPLGLGRTTLPSGAGLSSPFLHGYQPDPPGPREDVSHGFSAAYAWASGGVVSTPGNLNAFIRGDLGAKLFSRSVQRQQLRFIPGNSEPIGPGTNSAGLGIFRYRTRCGTVYGHTGNTSGYTQFMAASRNGRRSVTVSVSGQITNGSEGPRLAAFHRLRAIEGDAVCAAMS